MILPSMNSLQILHHIGKDEEHFKNSILNYGNELEKFARKHPKCEIFKHKSFFRKETNQKYIVFYTKKTFEKHIYFIILAEVRVSPTKFNYYIDGTCYGNKNNVTVITDHFLEQYTKRTKLQGDKTDALMSFIRENQLSFEVYNNRKTKHSVWASRSGISLCVLEDKGRMLTRCTFIGFDEMKPSQFASFNKVASFFDDPKSSFDAEHILKDIMKNGESTRYKYSASDFSISQAVANDLYSDYFKDAAIRDEEDYKDKGETIKCKEIDVYTSCRAKMYDDFNNNISRSDLLRSIEESTEKTIYLMSR